MSTVPAGLRAALETAQRQGSIGPGSIEKAVAHAAAFFASLPDPSGWRCCDLGSGGGLPGLPLALAHPDTTWVLLDAWEARVAALRRTLVPLGLAERVEAVHARAEDYGHGPDRETFDVVVSRSFGAPAFTVECAAPLLRPGGVLVMSAAPDAAWPDAPLTLAGLSAPRVDDRAEGRFVCFTKVGPCDSRLPRRPAAQRRQPLF